MGRFSRIQAAFLNFCIGVIPPMPHVGAFVVVCPDPPLDIVRVPIDNWFVHPGYPANSWTFSNYDDRGL